MKRFLACLLLTAALFCGCRGAMALGGEDFKLENGIEGTLLYDSSQLEPSEGPGARYHGVNISLSKGAKVNIYSQLHDSDGFHWVLAEANGQWLYLVQESPAAETTIRCNIKKAPKEPAEMESTWQCSCYEPLRLRQGPGANYGYTGFVMGTEENAWVVLTKGDWALVECTNAYDDGVRSDDIYFRRGWVPFSSLIY